MEAWITPALANGIGVVGVIVLGGFLIWRGFLIPRSTHREIVAVYQGNAEKAEAQRDRWESVALRSLEATERLAEPMTVTAKVLTKLPSPREDGEDS